MTTTGRTPGMWCLALAGVLTLALPRAGVVPIEKDTLETAWAPYVGVADLGATLKRTVELGGRVLMEPRADFVEGRIALLADPGDGAFFVYELEEAAK